MITVNRSESKGEHYSNEVGKAKGKEQLRDLLMLIETYLNNPTKYCFEKIVGCYIFSPDIRSLDLQDDVYKWSPCLSMTVLTMKGEFEKQQGDIYIKMTMLKELGLNLLNPERNR